MTRDLRRRIGALMRRLVAVTACLSASAVALAQGTTPPPAIVSGVVTTLEGTVRLPGVVLTLALPDGAPAGEAISDDKGQYRMAVQARGALVLKARIEGFHPYDRAVTIEAGGRLQANVELRLLEIEQQVDVTPASDAPMNLARPLSPQETIDGRELSASAISSGNLGSALRWLPGVAPYGREWAIKGGRPNQMGLQVEAAQVVDPAAGTSPVQLPGDAVSSIQVLANPYAVEFGRFSSGVVVVSTRSGADKWSATVNNFLPGLIMKRGNPFKPVGFESIDPRVAVGGPIRKERLFIAQSTQFRYMASEVGSRPQGERRVSKSLSSFTRLDWVVNTHHSVTGTFTLAPENSDWVTLSTFNPPDVTANLRQRVYRVGLSEMAQLPRGLVLESLGHFTRYRSGIEGHGPGAEMSIAPDGNTGTYFSVQDRRSDAWQWSQTLSAFIDSGWGQHLLKGGLDLLRAAYVGDHEIRPVNLLRQDGTLTRRITQSPSRLQYEATDVAGFVQDRWHVHSRLLLEAGVRLERDGVFERVNVIPRVGAALSLDPARRATIRGGFGYFYERTPTLAGAFDQMAPLVEEAYGPDGITSLGPPTTSTYRLATDMQTPRSRTWNIGVEHRISPSVSLRFNHLHRSGLHELLLDSNGRGPNATLLLSSTGRSKYRDTEIGARLTRGTAFETDISYTHSSSEADLNDAYGHYLNMVSAPVVRGNQFGPTDTDTPHRLVVRGRLMLKQTWWFEWAGEARSGLPYSAVDDQLEYVGARNSRRFPWFHVVDVSIERRFKVGRFQPWIGIVFLNALNTFNPVDVQRSVASPGFGTFYSSDIRQIRFTVHFR